MNFSYLICGAITALTLITGNAKAAEAEPTGDHRFQSSKDRTLDYADYFYLRITAPIGKRFCFPNDEFTFAHDGFFVPLMHIKCEDIVGPDSLPQVHVTFHPNVMDDEWQENRRECAKDLHYRRQDKFLTVIKFMDLGRIKGLRAQGCVRVYGPNKDYPKGYYMSEITLLNFGPDHFSGKHYVFLAHGEPQYRAQLDSLLTEVVKGIQPTPAPKN